MIYIYNGNIFISNTNLYIISWKQLIIAHIACFDPHKGGTPIRLGVTVPFRSADIDLFHVFFQFIDIILKQFVLALLYRLMFPFSMNKTSFIQLP